MRRKDPWLPAKLCLPRLHGVVARERLFERLDAGGAAAWICGPPGAGKTMLAASYVERRGVTTVWYRFDGDDNDAAKLFETLALALTPRAGAALPRFAAENAPQP